MNDTATGGGDLLIRGVRLKDGSGPWDISVAGGLIADISPSGDSGPGEPSAGGIDGTSHVVVPGLLDAHCHMDQSLMLADWASIPASDEFLDKIRTAEAVLLGTKTPSMVARVEALARSMVAHGTLVARSHASITTGVGLAGVEALLEVRQRLAGVLTMQIVAFPQFGTRDPSVHALMEEAIRLGCDVVGGMDPGLVDRDIEASLSVTFGLAERYGVAVDIHVHDPGLLGLYELERICDWTDRAEMAGRVVASHALCLGELESDTVAATLERLATAGVAIVSTANPNAAMPRVDELEASHVLLGLGSDTAHTSAPFGTSDMLKKANLLAQRHTYVTDAQLLSALERTTTQNARILGVAEGHVEVGAPADLLIGRARNGAELIASPPRDRIVVSRGFALADTRT